MKQTRFHFRFGSGGLGRPCWPLAVGAPDADATCNDTQLATPTPHSTLRTYIPQQATIKTTQENKLKQQKQKTK